MQKDSLSTLRLRVEAVFEAKGYKKACIIRYNHTWDHLQAFLDARSKEFYNSDLGQQFLDNWHDGKPFNELTHRQQERVRHIEVLTNMLLSGTIRENRHINKVYLFDGDNGAPFRAFIAEQSKIKKASSIRRYEERISALYLFLNNCQRCIADMDVPLVIQFVAHLEKSATRPNRNSIIMTNRVFFRYLCEHKLLKDNRTEMWMSLLHINYYLNRKILSVYTAEEVEKIIGCIDRSHPQGKRDYAMILLAARYGLRASDIISFRFVNIDWESNRIILTQVKTQKRLILPLSEEVGTALVEYIRNGRPNIDTPFLFISAQAPYKPLQSNVLAANIAEAMRVAGIDSSKRKHGPHALRHSLASNLLKANETLPVISEILGHTVTESTITYLRVDINRLRRCALEVPLVLSTFYSRIYE
ncbi:MAG: tyrosine-type recombinase/integrase [Tannerella sp.]|jgi:site-specific recombinase XerD|nr:tyrosine-type recombinase/integrase [Tannerella sp.]